MHYMPFWFSSMCWTGTRWEIISSGGLVLIGGPGINSSEPLAGKKISSDSMCIQSKAKRVPINHSLGLFTLARQNCGMIQV